MKKVIYCYEDYYSMYYSFAIILGIIGGFILAVELFVVFKNLQEGIQVRKILIHLLFIAVSLYIFLCKGIIPFFQKGIVLCKESKHDFTKDHGTIEKIQYNRKISGVRYFPGLLQRNYVPLYPFSERNTLHSAPIYEMPFPSEYYIYGILEANLKINGKWYAIVSPRWFRTGDEVQIKYLSKSKFILEMGYYEEESSKTH